MKNIIRYAGLIKDIQMATWCNSMIHSLRSIPLLGKKLPERLYGNATVRILAQFFSIAKQIFFLPFKKALYLAVFLVLPCLIMEKDIAGSTMHLLFFLTLAGGGVYTNLIAGNQDEYYRISQLRMRGREAILIPFIFSLFFSMIGFWLVGIVGLFAHVPVWVYLTFPVFYCLIKINCAAIEMICDQARHGAIFSGIKVGAALLIFAAGYVTLYFDCLIGSWLYGAGMLLFAVGAVPACRTLLKCSDFTYRRLSLQAWQKTLATAKSVDVENVKNLRKQINTKVPVTSNKKGFSYLNEIFIKRHRNVYWKFILIISGLIVVAFIANMVVTCLSAAYQEAIAKEFSNVILALPFVLYLINQGGKYNSLMFTNCDHSLLTYPFYKRPKQILHMFVIRLKSIILLNLIPGGLLGAALCSTAVFVGCDWLLSVALLLIPPMLSIFFSVHYLTLYYLLQPFTKEAQVKNAAYNLAGGITYWLCYLSTDISVGPMQYAVGVMAFCVIYVIVASILVYRFAPKTFRIRQG